MAILSGRDGQILYDPAATTPAALVSLDKWKLSNKVDKIKVTCFGAVNHVYVPGMPDLSGTVSGFWDSANVVLFDAVTATAPGLLKLVPHTTESTFFWSGLAYFDADIDCSVDGAPAVTGSFMAAGPWTMAP
jgi:hypothetical protein